MKQLCYLFLLIFVFTSCEKVPLQDTYNISEYTEKYIEENEEIYVVDNADASFELQTMNGCTMLFKENSFLKNGNNFEGVLRFRFLFISKREEMIKAGMPTIYKDSDGNISMLESAGEFLFEAYDNSDGEVLSLIRSYTMRIPRSLSGSMSNKMSLFVMPDQDSKFWTKVPGNQSSGFTGVLASDVDFQLILDNFGWINCDDFVESPDNSYSFSLKYPSGFDESNSFVFLSFDSLPNSIGNLTLKIPENETGKIIFVARDDHNYYVSHESFEATSDIVFDFTSTTLEEISTEEFDQYLASLF